MSSLYDVFETNKDIEKTGIILDYGSAGKIKIARAGGSNVNFAKVLEQKMRPYRRQFETGAMADSVANKLLIETFAETVILGWEGVVGRDGNPLPFSRENVIQVLNDLPDLFVDLREQAMKVANFRADVVEADAGN